MTTAPTPGTPRALVADALAASLEPAGVIVLPFARDVGVITAPTVMVRLDEVSRLPQAPASHQLYQYTLVVLVPQTEPGPADVALDALLEDVLFAVEHNTTLPQWRTAKRGVWLDTTTPAYEVTLDVPHLKEQ